MGHILTAANANGTYAFSYDATGRLTQVTEPFALTLNYAYDNAGNQTQVIDSTGGTTVSTYDSSFFLTRRTYQGQGNVLRVDFAVNKEGWTTTQTRYSDLAGTSLVAKSDFSYDGAGQVTSILTTDATPATISQFVYSLDSGGQVTQVVETQNSVTTTTSFAYDSANQLTNDGTAYSYDGNGNRTGGSYLVGSANEMVRDANWDYTFTNEGDLSKKTSRAGGSSESWTYAWSANNLLTQVKHYDSSATLVLTVNYKYDAFGEVVQKDVAGGQTTKYGLDGWNPNMGSPVGNENFNVFALFDSIGTLTNHYLWSNRAGDELGRIDTVSNVYTTRWTLNDRLNSVRDVIDNAATLIDSLAYDGFGVVKGGELSVNDRGAYAWTGQERDLDIGLQRHHARWYDPAMGKWISEDPKGFSAGDSNLYRYVNNRTMAATDPSGLDIILLNCPFNSSSSGMGNIGHSALIVGHSDSKWFYYSFNSKGLKKLEFATYKELIANKEVKEYNRFIWYRTTADQDNKAKAHAESYKGTTYKLGIPLPFFSEGHSCNTMAIHAMKAAELPVVEMWMPNDTYDANAHNLKLAELFVWRPKEAQKLVDRYGMTLASVGENRCTDLLPKHIQNWRDLATNCLQVKEISKTWGRFRVGRGSLPPVTWDEQEAILIHLGQAIRRQLVK